MKTILLLLLLLFFLNAYSQTFVGGEQDSTIITEYNDDHFWAYYNNEDFVVGMTNCETKDHYGHYYQLVIYINNLSDTSITFIPENITSTLRTRQEDTLSLEVYSYDEYMKKIKRSQSWALALTSFSAGLNAGMAGYSTSIMPNGMPISTYNATAASTANMAAQNQIMTLGMMMENDKKFKEQGYLRKTTIHPNEAIIGYINIKQKRGLTMTVNIPINEQVFSFNWDVAKKKREKSKKH